VEKAVLVEADIDERGLEAGQDVVDLALVDVSDYRAASSPLYVQLGNMRAVQLLLLRRGFRAAAASAARGLLITLAIPGERIPLRLQNGDSGFATVHRDEYSFSQSFLS
jgi:hypothetical protein